MDRERAFAPFETLNVDNPMSDSEGRKPLEDVSDMKDFIADAVAKNMQTTFGDVRKRELYAQVLRDTKKKLIETDDVESVRLEDTNIFTVGTVTDKEGEELLETFAKVTSDLAYIQKEAEKFNLSAEQVTQYKRDYLELLESTAWSS